MDSMNLLSVSPSILPEWVKFIREVALQQGFGPDPVLLRGGMEGREFIAAIRQIGGEVIPLSHIHYWVLRGLFQKEQDSLGELTEDLTGSSTAVSDFQGMVEIRLDGKRYLAARVDFQIHPLRVDQATILIGDSLEALLEVSSRLKDARSRISNREIRVFGTSVQARPPEYVSEEDLILPATFQDGLFGYLDAFWRSAGLCNRLRIAPSRGVLLVGTPGTGKTQTVRHLLGRYPDCRRFIFVNDSRGTSRHDADSFHVMVQDLAADHSPALVVIEDIDRMLESGATTPQFLLNVLDGLFQPDCPVLWIATSNDPTKLEDNEEIAAGADGLTGAHLKEVCYSAALQTADEPAGYGEALREELQVVLDQHRKAKGYGSMLKVEQRVGFAG